MNTKTIIVVILLGFSISSISASGLLMPVNKNYPKDFLRHKSSQITIKLNGLIAETTVYEEFINEWNDSTDVVYNFPLPADARATQFLYWYKGTAFEAVLKVKEQIVNPGTGEGGVAALVNTYIGNNGIKVFLRGVPAGGIQKVELHYISKCDYYLGKCTYTFPLNTSQFTTNPLDQLQINIGINSNTDLLKHNVSNFSSYKVIQSDPKSTKIEISQPKTYLNHDFEFSYETDPKNLGVDFYSTANDTTDGHFALVLRPQNDVVPDSLLPKKIIFLLSTSTDMMGQKIDQSIDAISKSIDLLLPKDYFNIILFNNSVGSWNTNPVVASSANITSAKGYLKSISLSYGTDLNSGLKNALKQLTDNTFSNSVLIFTSGRSVIDPKEIETLNTNKVGIFPIGIGDNIDRSKLEMIASLNYGYVTYISLADNISSKMLRLFNQISKPILKNVAFEYGLAGVSQVVPIKPVSTYAGSQFFMVGRYKNSGISSLSLAGTSVKGVTFYGFKLDFTKTKNINSFTEAFWAKETLDEIERQIDVYGEKDSLKQKAIKISLAYGIRCRYTSYVADYITRPHDTSVDNFDTSIPTSYIVGNYPNPFNPSTTFRIYLDKNLIDQVKFIRIFNVLGQLVAILDLSNCRPGFNEIVFNGKDLNGDLLPSGIYFASLQIGSTHFNTTKLIILK